MHGAVRIALPVIAPRAVVVWGLTRLVFAALPMAVGEPFGSLSPSPIAVVLLLGIIGLIDVHVRGERLFWANLAVRPIVLSAIYSATAIPAECLLALAPW